MSDDTMTANAEVDAAAAPAAPAPVVATKVQELYAVYVGPVPQGVADDDLKQPIADALNGALDDKDVSAKDKKMLRAILRRIGMPRRFIRDARRAEATPELTPEQIAEKDAEKARKAAEREATRVAAEAAKVAKVEARAKAAAEREAEKLAKAAAREQRIAERAQALAAAAASQADAG